jgi:hypothetical protein
MRAAPSRSPRSRRTNACSTRAFIEPVMRMLESRDTRIGTLAAVLRLRGEIRWRMGDRDAALADGRRGLEVAEALRGENAHSNMTGHCALLLCEILSDAGDGPAARAMLELAIAHLADTLGEEHPATRRARSLAA